MRERPLANEGLVLDIKQHEPNPLEIAVSCSAGQTLALFGASGSGKTSTLRAIAGLNRRTMGRITVNGATWLDSANGINLSPHQRKVGYVFQEYALFPHLTALSNVMATLSHLPRAQREAQARTWLTKVNLEGFENQRPSELSGGQQQRVAVARALAREPDILLLDEPFSAVDVTVRNALYYELVKLRRALSLPIVLVTHDFHEVLRFADTVAVLEAGKRIACGPVNEICNRNDLSIMRAQADPASVMDAVVVAHHTQRGLIELGVRGQSLLASMIDAPVGAQVRVRLPAREVVLATEAPRGLSIHNRLAGQVAHIVELTTSTAAVYVAVGDMTIVAHITCDAVRQLSLTVGSPVLALVKSVAIDTLERPVAPAFIPASRPWGTNQ